MTVRVQSIQRYPVKGLSAQSMPFADLGKGETLLNDRAYAVENGPSGFDPTAPGWMSKIRFLCGMKIPKLARLKSHYDDASGVLTIDGPEGGVEGNLRTEDGREKVEAFLSAFMGDEKRGPLRVLSAPQHSFSDISKKVLSFINLASVEDIGRALNTGIDPVRFRGNVHLSGMAPWEEAIWAGRKFQIGSATFKAGKTIQRCLATHVDPERGVRDLDVMGTIRTERGDVDCGVYAHVIAAGRIAEGDEVRLL